MPGLSELVGFITRKFRSISAPRVDSAALADIAREHLEEARKLRRAGEYRAAMRACHEAVALTGPTFDAHFQLGLNHTELLEHVAAIGHYEKAVALEPGDSDALYMLGTVLHDVSRPAESAAACERAIGVRPDFREAHFQLGLARFELADFGGAMQSFSRCFALRRGKPWDSGTLSRPDLLTSATNVDSEVEMAVNTVKIGHDIEQMEHLLAQHLLPSAFGEVIADYRHLHAEIRGTDEKSVHPFDAQRHPLVAATYKQPLYLDQTAAPPGELLNANVDWRGMEESYLAAKPPLVAVDNLLTPKALEAVRRFCEQSTVWNDIKAGYLGAYLYDGFASEALLRIAAELRERLPRIMGGQPLQILWGYKYDSALPGVGIGVHADSAAVNVNFWITAEDANLNPDSGGLLVYSENAPRDWSFAKYNTDPRDILQHLQTTGASCMKVPYRANRAVIFDSDLFHATDAPVFRPGYHNRRINITLLYGLRGAQGSADLRGQEHGTLA